MRRTCVNHPSSGHFLQVEVMVQVVLTLNSQKERTRYAALNFKIYCENAKNVEAIYAIIIVFAITA